MRYRIIDLRESTQGNIAFADIYGEGINRRLKAYSARSWTPRGYLEIAVRPIFRTLKINKYQQVNGPGAWSRLSDSEARIFEQTARIFDRAVTELNQKAQGRIYVHTELEPCKSCLGVAKQHLERHPYVDIYISYEDPF